METVQADAEEKDLESVVNSMMKDAGLAYKVSNFKFTPCACWYLRLCNLLSMLTQLVA
jgi:hypothetical protein